MPFSIRDLSVLAYANGFTLWHYKATQSDATALAAPGFFADAADMLASGDMVMASTRQGGRLLCIALTDAGPAALPLG